MFLWFLKIVLCFPFCVILSGLAGQSVVIRAQRDCGLCALRLTVRGVEAARKLMKLQRGMLAQEGQQGVLCHDLAAGDLRAGVAIPV